MLVRSSESVFVQSSSWWQCGGMKQLHKAECGPELRTAMTKAQEPGNWHNCLITICHLYIQGETEIQQNTARSKGTQNFNAEK